MLRESKVVSIRRLAPTNQTGLLGHGLIEFALGTKVKKQNAGK
jgi:hypothetical protein